MTTERWQAEQKAVMSLGSIPEAHLEWGQHVSRGYVMLRPSLDCMTSKITRQAKSELQVGCGLSEVAHTLHSRLKVCAYFTVFPAPRHARSVTSTLGNTRNLKLSETNSTCLGLVTSYEMSPACAQHELNNGFLNYCWVHTRN